MRPNGEIFTHVHLIRREASATGSMPLNGDAFVQACLNAEAAGFPRTYHMPATAQEYALFRTGEQLAVTLAARVGNPHVSPIPPLWPLLGVLLLGWRHAIPAKRVMQTAAEYRNREHVERGLAIVAYLFPELEGWLADVQLKIPHWEKAIAVPLAARKLIQLQPGAYSESPVARHVRQIPWRVTGASRRGHIHFESGLKNQDAIKYVASSDAATVVLALADGHGANFCFRSHTGSQLAVDTASELLQQFAQSVSADESASLIANRATTVLAHELTQSWRAAVHSDLEKRPFTVEEWNSLAASEGWNGQYMVRRRPELAYGSTVMAILATGTYVLSIQLGDGDILFVDMQGYTRRVIPKDPIRRKQTASLSRRTAASELRVHVQDRIEGFPAVILAATDGYANSYKSDEQFLEIGREYLRLVSAEGFQGVERRFKSFRDETSPNGCGDDITIGLLSRFDRDERTLEIPTRTIAAAS
jgi:serine/threonine protein phosphatase PrpC